MAPIHLLRHSSDDVARDSYRTLKCLMPRDDPPDRQPFYLIVADYDRGVFAVKGPMNRRPAVAVCRS